MPPKRRSLRMSTITAATVTMGRAMNTAMRTHGFTLTTYAHATRQMQEDAAQNDG